MSFDLHHTTKAIARWLENDENDATNENDATDATNKIRFLAKGDPKTRAITLTTTFDSNTAFFELGVHIKLKGLDATTKVILRICASTIASLGLSNSPIMAAGIQEELNSTALGLEFVLNDAPAIIAHSSVLEPVSAARKPSGAVLDMIRDLCKVRTFSIYVEARDAPNELKDISDAVSQGLFTSCDPQYQILSMYDGAGGKVVNLSVVASPPSYEESEKPPPPPPLIERSSKKRPRQDSYSERDDVTLLWAELHTLKQIPSRLDALEAQNKRLRQENSELGKDVNSLRAECEKSKQKNVELVKDVNNLREEYNKSKQATTELVTDINNLQAKYEELETHLANLKSENETFADNYEGELKELREDMDEFEDVVACVQEGQITEESLEVIQSRVIGEVRRRLADG
ncbi:hypothetical protein ACHAO7_010762 [Fusarium culmorum]